MALQDARVLQGPISRRTLTTRESIILLESSKLNGLLFKPWETLPSAAEFDDETKFEDESRFVLSEAQVQQIDGWWRCGSIQKVFATEDTGMVPDPSADFLDLVQDMTTDCSVVASLCALTSRTHRGFTDLCQGMVYPWDTSRSTPKVSPNGKYIFRFYFNGAHRRVVIDDRLPMSKSRRRMFVFDQSSPPRLWPALIEKAYLKVRGGYDFPGSNSGTDLFVLTGWIPEQLFLQSDDVDRVAMWKRLSKAFQFGDVLMTFGTGAVALEEERGSGLSGQHDYAVIDMQVKEGKCLFLVKNPWSRDLQQKEQSFARQDLTLENDALKFTVSLPPKSDQEPTEVLSLGHSWIGLDDIFHYFESLYLNWNPSLFSHRADVHFSWDLANKQSPDGSFRTNPQYTLQGQRDGLAWVLLNRHFLNSQDGGPHQGTDEGFISLYAFEADHRIFSSSKSTQSSHFVDSPNTLLKLDLSGQSACTIAIAEQSLPRLRQNFTLSCFSLSQVDLTLAKDRYSWKDSQQGRWSRASAGGNSSSVLYHTNPQYTVKIEGLCDLSMILESQSTSISIHLALFRAHGKRVREVASRDIVAESGEYTKFFCCLEVQQIPPGTYTAVCSTFEEGQLADYEMYVSSTKACHVGKLPAFGAGQFSARLAPQHFPLGKDQLCLPMSTETMNCVSVTARSSISGLNSNKGTTAPLKVSIVAGRGSSSQTLAVSGDGGFTHSDPNGPYMQDVNISPDMCFRHGIFLVINRLATSSVQHNEVVNVSIHSERPLRFGEWQSEG